MSGYAHRLYPGKRLEAPQDFRVTAIMTAYNEADIIVHSLNRLIKQGIAVYLIDNWSTDGTFDLAQQPCGTGLLQIERFPAEGPSEYSSWKALLSRIEEIAGELDADWYIHHDADEIRVAPWAGVNLKDALYAVDQAGFNCVDHTVLIFPPIDNGFVPGTDFEAYFNHFRFSPRPGHIAQIKAWKNLGRPISLAESGGHEVRFEGRKVYPNKFLLKHYPIRSQLHGEKKVFLERKARWDPVELAEGWHTHYDQVEVGHLFLRDPSELMLFDERLFDKEYVSEPPNK